VKDKYNISKAIFFALVGIFVLILAYFIIPAPIATRQALFPFAAVLAIVFVILGAALIFLTSKSKIERKQKVFLILTGAAPTIFLLCVILHNFVYGLFIYLFGEGFWDTIGLKDEPFFFFIAIFISPILFLVGMIGSLVMFIKKRKHHKKREKHL